MASSSETKDGPPPQSTLPDQQASSTETAVEGDSDPDLDDLDDVLDQFNANAPSQPKSQPPPSSSGPGRPSDIAVPSGPAVDESQDDFMARLTKEMSDVMTKMGEGVPGSSASSDDLAKMGKELEDFTHKMEAEGIKPEDLLKAILGEDAGTKLGDAAHEEHDRMESESKSRSPDAKRTSQPTQPTTFEDTIRRTMERMEDSGNKATTAAQESSEEDMLANLMKALGEGGGEGEGDMSKMLMGMMEQLTNKEMLYEPMKELDQKFPDWLAANKSKLKTEDYARYVRQKVVVKDIVGKFEEKSFSDDDPKCREYIWEKMQKMQEEGAPPEELIQNPFPSVNPEELGEGCPTQ